MQALVFDGSVKNSFFLLSWLRIRPWQITPFSISTILHAPVIQKLDSAIHRINLNPADYAIGFPNTYPLGSELSGG